MNNILVAGTTTDWADVCDTAMEDVPVASNSLEPGTGFEYHEVTCLARKESEW